MSSESNRHQTTSSSSSSEQQAQQQTKPSKQDSKLQKIRESRTLEFIRPHRCDIRLEEFYAGTWKTFNPLVSFKLFSTYLQCLRSEVGQEPTTPLHYISDDAYDIYKQVYQSGRVREKFFQNTVNLMAKERLSERQQQQQTKEETSNVSSSENSTRTAQQPKVSLPELQRLKK
ncbi:hypothetical protein FDP41_002528 [Naegleria fowleri]|uniref:Uncharacterized protein n=1 Tax=Naegleria fowleri TaxID=5763 RepID=A0A6A5BYB6_NAEFO|nr:uncharacterized protein FDP41_002528 [Naegleria fowleri]KAF0978708.1 hypothetical protein FDP41_002528 [Naegleria fowleri]CAG4714006.1 unnamed protein product [Naegleria fowleri]